MQDAFGGLKTIRIMSTHKRNGYALSMSCDTFTPSSTSRSWLILFSKSLTNRSNVSTRYGRASGFSKNWNSFCVS
jgi:hypothetical protein